MVLNLIKHSRCSFFKHYIRLRKQWNPIFLSKPLRWSNSRSRQGLVKDQRLSMQCLQIFLLSLAIDIYQPVLTIWDKKMKVWKYLKIALEEISGKSIAICKKGMHYAQWRNRHFSPFRSVAVVQMGVFVSESPGWNLGVFRLSTTLNARATLRPEVLPLVPDLSCVLTLVYACVEFLDLRVAYQCLIGSLDSLAHLVKRATDQTFQHF